MANVVCEYIWLDADNHFRSKTKVLINHDIDSGFPLWNFDGSSTKQASGKSSEVFVRPIKVSRDPFRLQGQFDAFLVLCDTWIVDKEKSKKHNAAVYVPHKDNTRRQAQATFTDDKTIKEDPWFGMEQEFFFTKRDKSADWQAPVGMKTVDGKEWVSDNGKEQGNFYCGVGSDNIKCREVAEHVLNNIMVCENIACTGYNWEVAPGQCEFQIFGQGVDVADSLLLFRYILNRTSEIYGYDVNYHPKPMDGDWNGSGCHTNYSTSSTRAEKGLDTIKSYIAKLEKAHESHIKNYGSDNKMRLTGEHETASWEEFTYGVADRGASVRIPTKTFFEKSGYFEDRRPSSNCDPYLVITKLVETTLHDGRVINIPDDENHIITTSNIEEPVIIQEELEQV
jgi:glutamine synthetase